MWSAIGRATAQQVRVGASLSIRSTGRIAAKLALRPAPVIPSGIRVAAVFARGFASAARPKTTSKAGTSKVAKKKLAAKKATAKKTATKKTAKKAKAPAAKKPKRVREKKPLTEEQKAKLQLRELRKTALLKEEPARLPSTPWRLYCGQRVKELLKAGTDANKLGPVMPGLAQDFKALSEAELDVSTDGRSRPHNAYLELWQTDNNDAETPCHRPAEQGRQRSHP
jgi:hypothetical protein